MSTLNSFTGTAAEFESNGVHINGKKVEGTALSILSQYGFVKMVGTAKKGEKQRGKPANVYEATASAELELTTV